MLSLLFTEGDQLYRLLKGFDVRCPDCKDLRFTAAAGANLERMADPSIRWVSFEGVRHMTSKKDASYTALDVTGQNESCIADTLSKQGHSMRRRWMQTETVSSTLASRRRTTWSRLRTQSLMIMI